MFIDLVPIYVQVYSYLEKRFQFYPICHKQRAQHKLRPLFMLILFSQLQKYFPTTSN